MSETTSLSPEAIQARIRDLQKRTDTANKKKAQYQGELEAKKQQLRDLLEEIKKAGYDPTKLAEEKEKAEKDLLAAMSSYERDLIEVERALEQIENNRSK